MARLLTVVAHPVHRHVDSQFPHHLFPKSVPVGQGHFHTSVTTEERSSLLPRGVPGPDAGVLTRVQIPDVGRRLDHQLKLGHHCERRGGSVDLAPCASVQILHCPGGFTVFLHFERLVVGVALHLHKDEPLSENRLVRQRETHVHHTYNTDAVYAFKGLGLGVDKCSDLSKKTAPAWRTAADGF